MVNFLFAAVGKLLVWLTRQLVRLIAWLAVQAVLHPRTTATVGVVTSSVAMLGWRLCVALLGTSIAMLSAWRAIHPVSFGRTAETWMRTWWRKWWVYRRTWTEVFTRCNLAVQVDSEVYLPRLKGVRSTPWWDHVIIEMQTGQSFEAFEGRSDELRVAFKGERIVLRELRPRLLEMALMRRDPLLEIVPPAPIPASVEAIDWWRVPVGRDEFGHPFTVSVLGGHTCISGSTGGGKAGLIWNTLRGIAPAIRAGLVRPVGVDPKAKELRRARALFASEDYAVTDVEVLGLLERLVREMGEAAKRDGVLGERDFYPREGRPLTLILLDEMAPLFKYWKRSVRDKIEDALGLLLTQGRAVGFVVMGAIQEPTKDTFRLRDLFTRRIALRLPTESHTEAALIEHAVDYGAACHRISESTPGVAFSLQDGSRSIVRARLGYVRDVDIDELVTYVSSARTVVPVGDQAADAVDVAA